MKLRRLTIAGFGRITGRAFAFDDGLNVIYGPNEAGKSTVATAIVASLYGIGRRKEACRPWLGDAYATTLVYDLDDGRTFEVQRDFTRDAKGVRVYDRDGNDVAAAVAIGKTIAPGEAHLHVPLEAFVNASCVLQQAVAIDGNRNTTIATALARALDGGPKEDAALGAIKRLEEARREHVGTTRSTVNNPLRSARETLAAAERDAERARTARDLLAAMRERRAAAVAERDRLVERRAAAEREATSIRAADIRARLDELRICRADLSALQAERARYDDVAGFPADRIVDVDAAFYAWQRAEAAAHEAEAAAAAAQLEAPERAELAARRADAGALDDVEFAALCGAAERADAARRHATAAAGEAASARRDGSAGTFVAIAVTVAAILSLAAAACAVAHRWAPAELGAALAALAWLTVAWRAREIARRNQTAARKQRVADESLATERAAAGAVAAVLDRFGISSVDDMARRRERLALLSRSDEQARRAAAHAADARGRADVAGSTVDALLSELLGAAGGSRDEGHALARVCANRRRERDGIENGLAMLDMRRREILRGDDEFELLRERDELSAAGVVPAEPPATGASTAAVARVRELHRLQHAADIGVAQLSGELESGEAAIPDLAALDESVAAARSVLERIEQLDRAFALALETVGRITSEAHQAFARRLEAYATDALRTITAGRYGELRVDPASLTVRVRVPETGAIEDLDVLSAGTRDQVYLLVRFAMARMFAEGLEQPPLLLDDPFAFWDERRVERCLPLIAQHAFGTQTLLFTSSRELAASAVAVGANRIDLAAGALV